MRHLKFLSISILILVVSMNQNPEQLARDRIDEQLTACGWIIQGKKTFNLGTGVGFAIREFRLKQVLLIIFYPSQLIL